MAALIDVLREQQHLTCGICMELYNHTTKLPKRFPCAHTYCLQCIQRAVSIHKHALPCPACKQQTGLNKGSDINAALPTNREIINLIDRVEGMDM